MRPIRQTNIHGLIRGLVILTLLAWATQTLVSQWGFGAERPAFSEEKFIASSGFVRSARLELKAEATVFGGQVTLKQIARWGEADAGVMQQIGDVVVGRFREGRKTVSIEIEDVKETLEKAGVGLGAINFSGSMACKVTRSGPVEEEVARWEGKVGEKEIRPLQVGVGERQTEVPLPQNVGAGQAWRTLREVLIAELAKNLNVPADSLEVRFTGQNQKLVELAEPQFRFEVTPLKLRKLGEINWDVTMTTAAGRQKATVSGIARMWQDQLVSGRPLAFKQPISEDDLTERRVLVDQFSDSATLKREQIVGQQAGRDISAGTVLNGKMIQAVQMARLGQLITVKVQQGRVRIDWVAEARESGTLGQTIKVRKPGTRQEFSVVLSGPQEAQLISAGQTSVALREEDRRQ